MEARDNCDCGRAKVPFPSAASSSAFRSCVVAVTTTCAALPSFRVAMGTAASTGLVRGAWSGNNARYSMVETCTTLALGALVKLKTGGDRMSSDVGAGMSTMDAPATSAGETAPSASRYCSVTCTACPGTAKSAARPSVRRCVPDSPSAGTVEFSAAAALRVVSLNFSAAGVNGMERTVAGSTAETLLCFPRRGLPRRRTKCASTRTSARGTGCCPATAGSTRAHSGAPWGGTKKAATGIGASASTTGLEPSKSMAASRSTKAGWAALLIQVASPSTSTGGTGGAAPAMRSGGSEDT